MTKDEAVTIAHLLAGTTRVVRAEALLSAGVDMELIKQLRRGWQTPVAGIYVVDDLPIDLVTWGHVALALGGDDAVITGWLACRLLGLRWVDERDRITVLIPDERRRRSRGGVRVRRTTLHETVPTVTVQGLRVAGVPWAVVDAAREISEKPRGNGLRSVRGVVLGAICDRRTTVDELERVLGLGSIWHSALARRACLDARRGALSPPEAEMADDAMELGLPFLLNVEVHLNGEFLGLVDGYLVGTGVCWESDSVEEHASDRERLDATLSRQKRFEHSPIDNHHVSPGKYRESPGAFWREVLAAVAKGAGDPPGLELRNPRGPLLQGEPRAA